MVSCAQLATVPALGRCPAGAAAAEFPADGFNGPLGFNANVDHRITWPAANVPAARLAALGVDGINVATDGATAAVEQARTLLEASAYPGLNPPSTIGDIVAQDNSKNTGYQQLANVVILVSLAIAGCTLAAGIAAGLADRKRPFSLLRLTGARLSTLRRVVALEGAVPLLAVAAVAIGDGLRRRRDVRHGGAEPPDGRARPGVLPADRRRHHRLPGHHRGDLPAADPHHRARGRQKRMTADAAEDSQPESDADPHS